MSWTAGWVMDVLSKAFAMLRPCKVCPRRCGVDRLGGQTCYCGAGAKARVASAGAHFGEESVLVGKGGSGTIFFQGCNLGCVFCQNYGISTGSGGTEVSAERLAGLMLDLQERGCANINLVTPTHYAPQIMEALALARSGGPMLPVVYNCGGYESVEMLHLLDEFIDIYMPDFKWGSSEAGMKYCSAPDYTEVATAALTEMVRQVGPLQLADGLAVAGVIVRHLVMPMDLSGSRPAIDIIAEVAPGCGINIMAQYRPCYRADEFPELLLLPEPDEIERLRNYAASKGLRRLDEAAAIAI